ncbi:putative DEAD box family helicase, phage associated [Synergistales bacterium]|nr:putative DEAD box family helicase, phage associated [Synergistales bacterium]
MITPRNYQLEAVNAIIDAQSRGVYKQLVSLPTGTGKTIIFGLLLQKLGGRAIILAHREELIQQAREKILMISPAANVGLLRGKDISGIGCNICVASVQSAIQKKKLALLRAQTFGLMIIDEAHHSTANTYFKLASELGFLDDNPKKLLVGVTATAYRGDKVALGEVFDEIVFERSTMTMIRGGFLCDVRGLSVKTDADLSEVHTTGGDLDVHELALAVDTPERNTIVAGAFKSHANSRQGVVFCVDVAHALNMAESLRTSGIKAAAVYGSMPKDERREVLFDYSRGRIQALTNCNVLTEGWDAPETSAIFLSRPTKSPVLYTQMVGRGLRLAPGKKDCLVVDFADVAGKHSLCGLATLAGLSRVVFRDEKETLAEAVERMETEETEEREQIKLRTATAELDLFERRSWDWGKQGVNFKLSLPERKTAWCRVAESGYTAFVETPDGIVILSESALPLGYAMGVCEDYARRLGAARFAEKNAPWRKRPASDGQKELMTKLKIAFAPDISKGEAGRLIDAALGRPATGEQIQRIADKGLHPMPDILTYQAAKKIIKEGANNGKRIAV